MSSHISPFKMALKHAEDLTLVVKVIGFNFRPIPKVKDTSDSENEDSKLSVQHDVHTFTSAHIVIMVESAYEPTTFVWRDGAIKIDPGYVEVFSIEEKLNVKELQQVYSIRMIRDEDTMSWYCIS
jgi:hypothetical protein